MRTNLSEKNPFLKNAAHPLPSTNIEDESTKLYEHLLEQFFPLAIRGMPSLSMISFPHAFQALNQVCEIPEESLFSIDGIGPDKEIYYFQTLYLTIINPLEIEWVSIDNSENKQRINLSLLSNNSVPIKSMDLKNLIIHLRGDKSTATILWDILTRMTKTITIQTHPSHEFNIPALCPKAINHYPFELQRNFLYRNLTSAYHGILLDYFNCPEISQSFSLSKLDELPWPEDCTAFTVSFELSTLVTLPTCLQDIEFLLNCCPVINLFPTASVPMRLDGKTDSYPLQINQPKIQNGCIYSANDVSSFNPQTATKKNYAPYINTQENPHGGHYCLKRNMIGQQHEHFIVLSNIDSENEILNSELSACNGNAPYKYLSENSLLHCENTREIALEAKLLYRPSQYIPYFDKKESLTHLIKVLSMQDISINSAIKLRQILLLFIQINDHCHRDKINAIIDLKLHAFQEIRHGAFLQGKHFQLTLESTAFGNIAEINLFISNLHHFFEEQSGINQLIKTTIIFEGSEETLHYQSERVSLCT